MSFANARLMVHGRRLLVERILFDRRPSSHVARELGCRGTARIAGSLVSERRACWVWSINRAAHTDHPRRLRSKRALVARERLRLGPARVARTEASRGCAAGVVGPGDRGLDPRASIHHETLRALRSPVLDPHRSGETRANRGRLVRARRFALEPPLTPRPGASRVRLRVRRGR